MKKTFTRRDVTGLLGLAGVGAAAMLSGCARDRARTLRVSFAPLSFRTVYEKIGKAFEDAHPGWRIELDGSRTYEDLAQKTLREAIVDDLSDVSHQGISNVRMLYEKNVALPLDRFMSGDPTWSELSYIPALADLSRYGGVTAGLPFALATPVVFFNHKIIAQAGWNASQVPTNWPDIIKLAHAIRARSGRNVIPLYFDYSANNAFFFQSLLFSFGGSMATPDERHPAFGGAPGQRAMAMFDQFRQAGQIDISREQANQAFAAGAMGMLFSTCSNLHAFRAQIADRFPITMAPFPVASAQGHIPGGGNALVITARDPERQKVAWAYARFVLSAAIQALMVRETGYGPVNRLAIDSPLYLAGDYARDPQSAVAVHQIAQLVPWYAFPGSNAIRITDGLKLHVQEVLTGRAKPAKALADMVAETQALMRPPTT